MKDDTPKGTAEQTLIQQRRAKLTELRRRQHAYPNDFIRDALSAQLHQDYGHLSDLELQEKKPTHSLAGRMMRRRVMGKAAFITLQDGQGQFQLYLRSDHLGHAAYKEFLDWDLGDIVGARGIVFRTKTKELSLNAQQLRLLAKSLHPLPDKHKGLADIEMRHRQRYLDLLINPASTALFHRRSQIVAFIREFFRQNAFLEVETPMLHNLPGGANANPFTTHHNALDIPLFLRIAPELFLKRLIIGGYDKVFEINRNFRNEGVSTKHNPEFTMLEFYQAYVDYAALMQLTEKLLSELVKQFNDDRLLLPYQTMEIDWKLPFRRIRHLDAILEHNPQLTKEDLKSVPKLHAYLQQNSIACQPYWGLGSMQNALFEKTVEHQLVQPTFVTHYPAEVSPLARRNDENNQLADRFELFVAGTEIANGFSELNDPEEQARILRQQAQAKSKGDDEAMHYDKDFITALEYGMPPVAGEGIGIDRLVMLLTNSASIRNVLLFPQLRSVGPNKTKL